MFAILVTVLMFLILAVIMEVAATALKITGMDIHNARFQALSALTGTGFTTKETEEIMHHRQRRRIIMTLMILGPIGLLTILGTMLLNASEKIYFQQIIILIIPLGLILIFTRNPRFRQVIHKQIERQLRKRGYPKRVILEETLQLDNEHGVCELKVDKNSAFLGKMLQETNFKALNLVVLAIKRQNSIINAPGGQDIIQAEDSLVLFGDLSNARKLK